MIDDLIFAVVLVNVIVFSGITVVAAVRARQERSIRVRWILFALSAAGAAFSLAALFRLLVVAVRLGWVGGRISEIVVSDWALAQSLIALVFGAAAVVILVRQVQPLSRADRIATALGDRFLTDARLEHFGLTDREREVLATIGSGVIADRDLGRALFMAPSTAATHVKHILRKTGLTDRRDLVLLAASLDARGFTPESAS